jgi:hypothetical protein
MGRLNRRETRKFPTLFFPPFPSLFFTGRVVYKEYNYIKSSEFPEQKMARRTKFLARDSNEKLVGMHLKV